MVIIVADLYARYYDLDSNELLSLKEAMVSSYEQEFEKTIYV